MRKLINWCKEYWLAIVGSGLLAFIPLYPKLPLLDVFQTWVYVRLEDFLVAVVMLVFVLMLWRQKLFPTSPLTIPIFMYWLVGLLSLVVAIFSEHPALSEFRPHLGLLHFLRRIEYMGLFFIGFVAVSKKPKALSGVIWTLVVTTVLIVIYGVGQKFYGFPAFLTMNEEFAKGVPLRLPPTARIPSTFGGHYDLAAFLVFVIPVFGSLVFGVKHIWQKLLFLAIAASSLVLLLFTASRISFGVYLIAIVVMLWWRNKKLFIVPVIIVSFILLNSVSTASERFYKTLRFSDVVIDLSTGQPIGTLETLEGGKATIEQQESPATENLPKGSEFIGIPPVAQKPTKTVKTIEVYTSSPLATGSGEIATVSGSFLVQKAFVYDISITTRFQGQWPKAMAAFNRNMLLGSGYSSLNVASDGDYLRMLGETGILGTAALLGIFIMAFYLYFMRGTSMEPISESFVTGIFAGLIGLLVNAVLIDVFEASKVAFPFWFLMGVAIALLRHTKGAASTYASVWWRVITSRVSAILGIFVSVLSLYGRALSLYFVGDDFTWLRWAASTVTSDIPRYFTDAGGFFYRPVPKLMYFLLYTFFWLKPWGYHLSMLMLFGVTAVLVFLILERRGVRRIIAFISALFFTSLAIHHENVIWISGLSGLVSTMFVTLSTYLIVSSAHVPSGKRTVLVLLSSVSAIVAMFSYEAALVAPVLLFMTDWMINGTRSARLAGVLLFIPLYWHARTLAHAVSAGGDYGVNWNKVVLNVPANTAAYISAGLLGPRVIEWFGMLRASMKQSPGTAFGALFFILGILGLLGTKVRNGMRGIGTVWIAWVVMALVSLLPYLGLGGVAERYALLSTVFLILAVGEFGNAVWESRRTKGYLWVGIVFLLMIVNVRELSRVIGDWERASNISETTMLTLKHNFFPLQDKQAFVFVHTPIRHGRAWIFPTGLTDAMWHMFKFNAFPYTIHEARSIEEGFAIQDPLGTPVVLLFDDAMHLEKAVRTTQTIEVDSP